MNFFTFNFKKYVLFSSLALTSTYSYYKKPLLSNNNQPKIIWVKIEGNLTKIQKIIDKQLEILFPLEQKFIPHLTIARIKYVKDIKYALEYIKNIKPAKIEFEIESIKLLSSKLTPIDPVYTTLKEYSCNPASNS